ncbi:MAG: histidine kinase [Leeuwenhoekiella sp.]
MSQSSDFIESDDLKLLVVASSVVLIIFLVVIIVLYVVFQNRKVTIIQERNAAEKKYLKEVAITQNEIRENTLKNLSWELHDNIGQLLSVAKMQLNILQTTHQNPEQINEINEVVGQSLQEVRSLSKGLNNEVISKEGLISSVQAELDRFQRLKFIETQMQVKGIKWLVPKNDGIMLFRIIQEFLSNVIKHASATHLTVDFQFDELELKIKLKDDGVGFDYKKVKQNSGTVNMKARAKLVGAKFDLRSKENIGTQLELRYPKDSVKKFDHLKD